MADAIDLKTLKTTPIAKAFELKLIGLNVDRNDRLEASDLGQI